MRNVSLLLVFGLLVAAGKSSGQEPKKDGDAKGEKAKKLVEAHLEKLKGAGAKIVPIRQEVVDKLLPKHVFFAVRYQQFPEAKVPPKPLTASNVFAVAPDGKLTHLTDAKGLQKFFQASLTPIKNIASAKEAGAAWLWLAQEFAKDGFFEFSSPKNLSEISTMENVKGKLVTTLIVTTKVTVEPKGGNKGSLSVYLEFRDGKLLKATETRTLKAGERPASQTSDCRGDPAMSMVFTRAFNEEGWRRDISR